MLTEETLVSKTTIILYKTMVILREYDDSRFKRLKIEYTACKGHFKLGDNPSLAVPQVIEVTFSFEGGLFKSISWELNLYNIRNEKVKEKIKGLFLDFTAYTTQKKIKSVTLKN